MNSRPFFDELHDSHLYYQKSEGVPTVDLSVREEELLKIGELVLMTYGVKPEDGSARFGADGGADCSACRPMDALVCSVDTENEEMKVVYLNACFDRYVTDSHALMSAIHMLSIGGNRGKGGVQFSSNKDIYASPVFPRLFVGSPGGAFDLRHVWVGRASDEGHLVGTIIKPELSARHWQGGGLLRCDEPQDFGSHCQVGECIPEVASAMRACIAATMSKRVKRVRFADEDAHIVVSDVSAAPASA